MMVVATTDKSNPYPESALVAFAENERLELFFQTNKHSRKAANLKINQHMSCVIGLTVSDKGTLQYQGIACQLSEETAILSCKKLFIAKKSPTAEPQYIDHPDAIFFKLTPSWIGFLDYSESKSTVIEVKKFT